MNKPRVRFAPSPTGPLHIGGVRTALYNYLFARHYGGEMLLRIEDTDSKRFVPGAEAYIIEALAWLGIQIDEGVGVGGEYGPYRQSERRDIYRRYVQQLLASGHAYKAYDTPEELEQKRNEAPNFQYDATTRGSMRNDLALDAATIARLAEEKAPYVVRFKVEPNMMVHVQDIIRGEVAINSSILDDKVLYKSSDDLPTYHLANIVDDHLMKITHVIRGEEWLPSAPLHKLLYQAFGWEDTMPQFAHLSLLLKPEGNGKLSKRDGDRLGFPVFPLEWKDPDSGNISSGYRESGYLPEAVLNFLALLGWNPGDDKELMTMQELIAAFSLEKCSKAGARFDFEKGKWFNHQYIQRAEPSLLADYLRSKLTKQGIETTLPLAKIVLAMRERVQLLPELLEASLFFFIAPQSYDPKTVKKRWKEETPEQLHAVIDYLGSLDSFDESELEQGLNQLITTKEWSMGAVMNCLRLALVGEPKGPHIHEIMAILGKNETIARIKRAIESIHL